MTNHRIGTTDPDGALNAKTSYQKFADRQTLGKLGVFGIHLCVEHALVRSLHATLPNASALFRGRGVGFATLISLSEAHNIIEAPLAEVLRRFNAVRNKCAHDAKFQPVGPERKEFLKAVEQVGDGSPIDQAAMDRADRDDPYELVAALVEVRALRVGATELDAG